jgi:hypothetical protein
MKRLMMRLLPHWLVVAMVILAVLPLIYAVWSWNTLTLLSIFLYDDPYPVSEAGRSLLYFLVHIYPIPAAIGLFLTYQNLNNKAYRALVKSLLVAYSGIFAVVLLFVLLMLLDMLVG